MPCDVDKDPKLDNLVSHNTQSKQNNFFVIIVKTIKQTMVKVKTGSTIENKFHATLASENGQSRTVP